MKKLLVGLAITIMALGGCVTKLPPIKAGYFEESTPVMELCEINYWKDIELRENLANLYSRGYRHVQLNMRNPGGEVFALWSTLETITEYQAKGMTFTAKCYGVVASAAVPVYVICDYREFSDLAWLMIHPHSGNNVNPMRPSGKPESVLKMYDTWTWRYAVIVAQHTTLSVMDVYNMMKGESDNVHWFDARWVLEHGFADKLF